MIYIHQQLFAARLGLKMYGGEFVEKSGCFVKLGVGAVNKRTNSVDLDVAMFVLKIIASMLRLAWAAVSVAFESAEIS